MAKKFEVTFVPQAFVPLYSFQTTTFNLPGPREFASLERAEEYARKTNEQWPTAQGSIRGVD
jgi:hypothetical protein